MHRKGLFKAFREGDAMIYRPPTLKAQEHPFSCELGVLERLMDGGFREGPIFFGGQRDTPTPCHSEFSPDGGSIPTFAIIPSSCEWARGT